MFQRSATRQVWLSIARFGSGRTGKLLAPDASSDVLLTATAPMASSPAGRQSSWKEHFRQRQQWPFQDRPAGSSCWQLRTSTELLRDTIRAEEQGPLGVLRQVVKGREFLEQRQVSTRFPRGVKPAGEVLMNREGQRR